MSGDRRGLLRWYPRSWRARYEDEMLALLDDQLGNGRASLRLRLSLCGHGLAERGRALRPFGPESTREARWRDGSLLVLVAWAAFTVGGAGFAKATEHFDQAVPAGSRLVPQVAFNVVAVGGILGGCLVLAGAALALPAFISFMRAGGGRVVKPHVRRAVALSALEVAATVPLLLWAHRLNDAQRNGGNVVYGIAFIAWAVLGVLTLAAWTAVAVCVGRHVVLRRSVLRLGALLAVSLAATMVSVAVASLAWCVAIATSAPWFLHGTPAGTRGSALATPVPMPLILEVVVMLAASVVGITGTIHMRHPEHRTREN